MHNTTEHNATLHYNTLITPHHNYNCNSICNYTTPVTLHYNYITTTTPLYYTTNTKTNATALHHTTSSSCGEVTAASNAATPKTQVQPPFGPSLCHRRVTATNLSYRFPIFETSATTLCGTSGIYIYIYIYIYIHVLLLLLPNDMISPFHFSCSNPHLGFNRIVSAIHLKNPCSPTRAIPNCTCDGRVVQLALARNKGPPRPGIWN